MADIYANVKIKKGCARESGDGEPSKKKEDVIYSTLALSTEAGPSHSDLLRSDDSAGPSTEPGSKIVMTGQAKERVLWISLCAFFFAVALIVGVLNVSASITHEKNIRQSEEKLNDTLKNYSIIEKSLSEKLSDTLRNYSIIEKSLSETQGHMQMLQVEKRNLTNELQWMKNNITEKEKNYTEILQQKQHALAQKDRIIKQLQTEKNEQTCKPQSWDGSNACCAEGWKYFSGKCYYFSTDKKTWTESRDACVAAGGDLVIISSIEEQAFLKRSYYRWSGQLYWVGLTDAVTEGDWRWLDGTRLSTTPIYWTGIEPDNWTGKSKQYPEGEDCALMRLNTDYYVLQDTFCNVQERKEKCICEAKAVK